MRLAHERVPRPKFDVDAASSILSATNDVGWMVMYGVDDAASSSSAGDSRIDERLGLFDSDGSASDGSEAEPDNGGDDGGDDELPRPDPLVKLTSGVSSMWPGVECACGESSPP